MENPDNSTRPNPAASPIENRIGAVFVPVGDMARAVEWYSRLLGTPIGETTHGGRIFDMPMQGAGLILDAHRPVANSSQPLFFLWTQDIDAAHRFLLANGVEVVGGVEHIGSVSTLTFKDLDGNLLMVCQRNLFGEEQRVKSEPMTLEEAYGSVTPLNRPEDFAAIKRIANEERAKHLGSDLALSEASVRDDPLWGLVGGLGSSDVNDLSIEHDRYLAESEDADNRRNGS